jgi:hypothetical protein
VAVRRKRSISLPPDLDEEVEAAAAADGLTYSAWLAAAARKELLVRTGLGAVAEFERESGAFTDEENAAAAEWAARAIERSRRSGPHRRSA